MNNTKNELLMSLNLQFFAESAIESPLIVGKREDVTENTLLLSPQEAPMLDLVGYGEATTQDEIVWYEDETYGTKTTATSVVTESATTIPVADGSIFEPQTVVKVGEELVLVTAVTGNNLTVTRAYADTVAGTVAVGDKIEFQFAEGIEGADARKARFKARTRHTNVTQIFDGSIAITGTAAAVSQHGIADLYAYEKAKKEKELTLQLEKAVISGVKYTSANGLVRQMGGIRQFIKTNVFDVAGAVVDTEVLNDAFQTIAEQTGQNVGAGYKIVVSPKQKRAISKMDADKINLTRQDNGRGQVVDYFVGDFGESEIVVNPNLEPDEIFIVDADRISIRPLQTRQFSHKYLGLTGDNYTGQIVGEYTLEFHEEKAHARIKGLKK